jgi:spore coat protein A, manganese oxidase
MLVNGKVWPFLNVEPRLYRFRILNGCNARILDLNLGPMPMWQIGAEGGLWDVPVPIKQLVLAPAERADVLVDFRGFAGQTLVVKNSNPPKPVVTPAPSLATAMQLRVGTTVTQPGPATIPASLPGRRANLPAPSVRRFITLNEVGVNTAGWFLNLNGLHFGDPATETPKVGTVEDWVYVNLTADTHPMHTHLFTHQVVGRTPFNVAAYVAAAGTGPNGTPGGGGPDPVRHRADATTRPGGTRFQGHHQGQPGLLHHHPGTVRPARRGDRAPGLRPPLPHRRARGQRHDASVHGHAVGRRTAGPPPRAAPPASPQ